MRRRDLRSLADLKIRSAQELVKVGHWSNAYYLAGYAIEMALKACIARQISSDMIPDKNLVNKIYTHNINDLLGLAGLKAEHNAKLKSNSIFAANWAICSEWTPESRYQEKSSAETHYLLFAITDRTHGVLTWIMNYW